jgi:pyruvate kinase
VGTQTQPRRKLGRAVATETAHQTLIVCTIGPASRKTSILRRMIRAGMGVARLNFAHGDAASHRRMIRDVRAAFLAEKRPLRMFADLPGPKIRVGVMKKEPVELHRGQRVLLTIRDVPGTDKVVPVQYERLTDSVKKGSLIYLNDGFIQLRAIRVGKDEVVCKVLAGGPLLSRKGLNIPMAPMYVDAVTAHDMDLMRLAMAEGMDAFGASFVEGPGDVERLRAVAAALGKKVHIIAKIERHEALDNYDALLKSADAVMVARGDLGVQVPLEEVPLIQKDLIRRANRAGKPVITATQMMESMVREKRPSRSDVSDVANAVLDGTDAVMLSEETAIGDYPVETVEWMGRICATTEKKGIGRKFRGGFWVG